MPAPNIPVNQVRAQIANFKHITSNTDRPWIYYVGGGSGSGLILLMMVCCLLYWCCKRTQNFETRSPACVTIANPENLSMMHNRVGANVREHHRRLMDRHHTTKTLIEAKPSLEIQDV